MLGLAEELFQKEKNQRFSNYFWPFLEELRELKIFSDHDVIIAEKSLGKDCSEAMAAFFLYLFQAARKGHVCVLLNEEFCNPQPLDLWTQRYLEEFGENCKERLKIVSDKYIKLLFQGLKQWKERDFTVANRQIFKEENQHYYFSKNWSIEGNLIKSVQKFSRSIPLLSIDENGIENELKELESSSILLAEQAAVIRTASKQTLNFLIGGPGTGKTYTAAHLVRLLSEYVECRGNYFQVAMAAPTGKAAAQLQASLNRFLPDSEIQAQTLHKLLDVSKRKRGELRLLDADLILVDEASMIDIQIMSYLFSALKPGSRLLLIGDPHQLPPVEIGGAFLALLSSAENLQPLAKCMRAEFQTIVSLSDAINTGDCKAAVHWTKTERSVVDFYPLKSDRDILKLAERHHVFESFQSPHEALSSLEESRFLSPLRKGVFGVDRVNDLLFEELRKKRKRSEAIWIPIMILRNHYGLGLFNGQMGVLLASSHGTSPEQIQGSRDAFAYFLAGNDEGIRKIPAVLLPEFEWAFCISVHKSQGSEFQHVLFLLPDGAEVFGRELLYTGVTRAKKKLTLIGEDAVFESMVAQKSTHVSAMASRMQKE